MSLSTLALLVYVFLQSANYSGWFSVTAGVLATIGFIFVGLRLLEAFVGLPAIKVRRAHSE